MHGLEVLRKRVETLCTLSKTRMAQTAKVELEECGPVRPRELLVFECADDGNEALEVEGGHSG